MVFWDLETKRQSLHLLFGICFAFIVYSLEPQQGFVFLMGGAALTLLISLEISDGKKIPLVNWVVHQTERKHNAPGEGVTWYFFGVLFTFALFYYILGFAKELIVASMIILAIGDSVCTGIGRKLGRKLLPKTQTKSWAGSGLGFIFSALAAPIVFLNIMTLDKAFVVGGVGAAIGMLTEAYLRKLNDNLTIPLAACAAMGIIGLLLQLPVLR